jgi:membrane protease YdiL (CAAX protease family)
MEKETFIEQNVHKREMPPIIEVALLIMTMLFCLLFAQGLNFAWAEMAGIDLTKISEISSETSTVGQRNFLRTLALISNAFSFILPALIFSYFLYRKNWVSKLKLNTTFLPEWMPVMLVFVFAGFFFSQFTFWLNQMIPLPEWADSLEEQTGDLIQTILIMESPWEFLFTLTIVAVIPALGEELIFRGILQRRLEEIMQKPHVAILISALIFSFIHFQFAGFLPRVVLGLLLGYLYYWTRNLWVPILAHFVINGFQVSAAYFAKDKIEKLETTELANLPASQMLITAAVSLIFIYLAGNWFHQRRIPLSN